VPTTLEEVELECAAPPENSGLEKVWTTVQESPDHPVARLIQLSERDENRWLVEGLWQSNAVVLVHSLEGMFKSIFAYQVSEALATAQTLLNQWHVPVPLRVGVLQTEMPENMVGDRLRAMYPDKRIPLNLIVSTDALKISIRQRFTARDKFLVIHNWLMDENIDVLVWDSINSVLASCGNPNSEEAASQFYNLLESLPHKGALVVRHDGKPSKDTSLRESNQKVRGSNLHAEIASAVIGLERRDKRTQKVSLTIGKLRHDSASDPVECWFDAGAMRLTLLPPPVVLLEAGPMTREALNEQLSKRFGLRSRAADDLIDGLQAGGLLIAGMQGHERTWALNKAAQPARDAAAAMWWPQVRLENPLRLRRAAGHPLTLCNLVEAAP
jgi:hypothetical protein